MEDLGTEYSNLLAEFAKQTLSSESVSLSPTGDPIPTFTPATGVVVQEPKIEEPSKQTTEPTGTTVQAVEQPPVEVKVAEPAQGFTIEDWDGSPAPSVETDVVAKAPELTSVFAELGTALGLAESTKDKDAVLNAIKNLKAEAEKAKLPDASQIPAELKKAIDLASKGGDYHEYLKVTAFDYENADEVELYENYVIDSSTGPDGRVDFPAIEEFLDNMPKLEKELRGKELKRQLINEQKRRVQEIEFNAQRQREIHDMELRSALNSFSEVDGFKVDDRHRKEIFDWVSSGKIMKDLFYGANGQLDANKIAKIAFRNLYHEKLEAHRKKQVSNGTKRELMEKLTNAQVNTPPAPANPNPTQGYNADSYLKSLIENFGIK